MPNCGANGCINHSNDCPEKSFHRLPRESKKELRRTWLLKINRKNIPKELYIYSGFNSGVGLAQAKTQSGDKQYKLQFSKVIYIL